MVKQITHKRGDTYKIAITVTEDDNVTPINITDWTIRSQVRRRDTLIAELSFEITDGINGKYTLQCEDTTDWPLGKLFTDIEYTDLLGSVVSSETFEIYVIRDITYD